AIASLSAWGRPPLCVQPRPTMRPSRTRMQPTAGFGHTLPRPRRARPSAAFIWWRSAPSLGVATQLLDEVLEVLGLAEIAVDRGEAHVGHGVEGAERIHDELPDRLGADVALPRALQPAHDAVDDPLDAVGIDRPLAAGDLDRAHELVAVEDHALAVLLDHHELAQLHPLEGREARAARRTEAPASDRGVILGRS